MSVYAVRGAISIEPSKNESAQMFSDVGSLADALLKHNALSIDDIISVQISQTPDLTQCNACTALRQARPIWAAVPLFCTQEPCTEGMMPRIVRILLNYRGKGPGIPIYLGKTKELRPDLST